MELRAGLRAPPGWRCSGSPRVSAAPVGVWRDFDVAGPGTGTAAVQLAWRDTGSLPGHSGGPVLDAETGTLAGVLIEGSEQGRFDRYTPVQRRPAALAPAAAAVAGDRPRRPGPLRAPRPRATRQPPRPGRPVPRPRRGPGRAAGWLLDPDPPGAPLVITGQPGAGKVSGAGPHRPDHPRSPKASGRAWRCTPATPPTTTSSTPSDSSSAPRPSPRAATCSTPSPGNVGGSGRAVVHRGRRARRGQRRPQRDRGDPRASSPSSTRSA